MHLVKIVAIQSPHIIVGTLIKILAKIQNSRVAKQQRHNQVVRFKKQNGKLAKKQGGWTLFNNIPCFDQLSTLLSEDVAIYFWAFGEPKNATPPVFYAFCTKVQLNQWYLQIKVVILIVISGSQSDCLSHAKKLTAKLDCLLLDDQKKAHTYLGQEFDAVIFDCHPDLQKKSFDPNAFGAITGTIRDNGYLLLLRPEKVTQDSLFLERFWAIVAETEHQTIDATSQDLVELKKPEAITHASKDQNNAVDRIIHVIKGHRRRPLVITADRGRGKSAALGIAARKLLGDGYKNIIICAPSKKMRRYHF